MLGPLVEGPARVLEAVEEGLERPVLLVPALDPALCSKAESVSGLLVAMDTVELPVGPCMVVRRPVGTPLHQLSGGERNDAVLRVAELLCCAESLGLGVPELSPGCVFVGWDGRVEIVGARGVVSDIDDVVALLDASEERGEAVQRAVDTDEINTLEQLVSALGGRVPAVSDPATIAGQSEVVWAVASSKLASESTMPPKVRVALAAGLTLALGFASAWFVIPSQLGVVSVELRGASGIEVACGDDRVTSSGERVLLSPSPTDCSVRASVGEQVVVGEVTRLALGAYDCRVNEGELECVRR